MFHRVVFFGLILAVVAPQVRAQDARNGRLPQQREANPNQVSVRSAWIDLRQLDTSHATPQKAPAWVESVTLVPIAAEAGKSSARTIFRIRVARPSRDLQ